MLPGIGKEERHPGLVADNVSTSAPPRYLVDTKTVIAMLHRRCALGFAEDTTPRARANEACTITHQATCPNLALHKVHQEVDLHPLLQHIRGLGRSADTAEEREIGARVAAAAELRLNRRSIIPTGTIDLSRDATGRGEGGI